MCKCCYKWRSVVSTLHLFHFKFAVDWIKRKDCLNETQKWSVFVWYKHTRCHSDILCALYSVSRLLNFLKVMIVNALISITEFQQNVYGQRFGHELLSRMRFIPRVFSLQECFRQLSLSEIFLAAFLRPRMRAKKQGHNEKTGISVDFIASNHFQRTHLFVVVELTIYKSHSFQIFI